MEIKTALYIQKIWYAGQYHLQHSIINVIEDINFSKFIQNGIQIEREYTPKKGDKLFFLPGCSIPRFKMKKFCEEYGTAMVKQQTSATALFIGSDTIKELVCGAPTHTLPVGEVLTYFKAHSSNFDLTIFEKVNSKNVYFNMSDLNTNGKEFGDLRNLKPKWEGNKHTMFVNDYSLQTYNEVIKSNKVYNQADVARKLNSGAEMTEEQYVSIKRLFESTDNSNKKVAIEIMSNCDFEKSAVYLLLLIMDYGDAIHDCRESRHVNFKSLVKFFGIAPIYNYDINDLVDTLLVNKLLSRHNLELIMPRVNETITESMGLDHFKPAGLTYSDEIYKGLQENILESTHNTVILDDDTDTLNPRI